MSLEPVERSKGWLAALSIVLRLKAYFDGLSTTVFSARLAHYRNPKLYGALARPILNNHRSPEPVEGWVELQPRPFNASQPVPVRLAVSFAVRRPETVY